MLNFNNLALFVKKHPYQVASTVGVLSTLAYVIWDKNRLLAAGKGLAQKAKERKDSEDKSASAHTKEQTQEAAAPTGLGDLS